MVYNTNETMEMCSFYRFHKTLSTHLDKVNTDHKPLFVYRPQGGSVIVLSVQEFERLQSAQKKAIYDQMEHDSKEGKRRAG